MNEEELMEKVSVNRDSIFRGYGIELNVNEILRLRAYNRFFSPLGKGDILQTFVGDSFVVLDSLELGHYIFSPVKNKKQGWKDAYKRYGLGFLNRNFYHGDKRLTKYCRRHVEDWRQERGMI